MITREDAEFMTYQNSKKISRFYKKIDRRIIRACKKGLTGIDVHPWGFDEHTLISLLMPYHDNGFTLIKNSCHTTYGTEIFTGISILWEKKPTWEEKVR